MTLYSSLAGGLGSRLPRSFPWRPAPVKHLRPTNNQQHSPPHSFHSFWALYQHPYGQESACKVFICGNSRVKVSVKQLMSTRDSSFLKVPASDWWVPSLQHYINAFQPLPLAFLQILFTDILNNTHSAVQVEIRLVLLLTDMKRNPQPKPETHGSMRKLQPRFKS